MSDTVDIPLAPHHQESLGMTMPQLLDHAARTWPHHTALHFLDTEESLTYAELREHVARLRTGLEAMGLRAGDKVAVMLRNQVEFPLTWLAVVEAGAVLVPVNPKYTRREVEFVIDDVEATWLVIADDLLSHTLGGTAPIDEGHLLVVGSTGAPDDTFDALRKQPLSPRTHQADRLDLVGIQFTSGTTGLPKGCMLTHEYWVHFGVYGSALFSDPQHYLADHPFYYMQNQAYLMMALAGGGTLHVTPGPSRRKFMGWLTDLEIDFAWIDEGMLSLSDGGDPRLKLRRAPVDGLPKTLHRELEQRFGLRAREWYASTEVGSGTFVGWDRDDLVGSGAMGLCVPGRESKIIDSSLQETPVGQPGELCLRGPGMMLGYWNRPDTNAELFLPGGWFRTGDIVRKDVDGVHYYLGRTRDMIRRSGENIAAVEVENHLLGLTDIVEAAAIPVPDARRGEEVKVLLVLRPDSTLTTDDIISWARQGLASFKVPRYVEFRDELPMTSSGKVRKAALRQEEPLTDATIDTLGAAALREALP